MLTPYSQGELLRIWQTLLLVQAQLTQERKHLTTSAKASSRLLSAMTGFLCWQSVPETSAKGQMHVIQCNTLTLTKQLWLVVKNVFTEPWLQSNSGSVLAAILQQKFDLDVGAVRTVWGELCAALVSAGNPGLLARLAVEDAIQGEAEVKRHLWTTLADAQLLRNGSQWDDFVPLLTMPFG